MILKEDFFKNHRYSKSLNIRTRVSKNFKKSQYLNFQVHYRALINLEYRDFPGKTMVIKFFPVIKETYTL